jgi:hypothetical protein
MFGSRLFIQATHATWRTACGAAAASYRSNCIGLLRPKPSNTNQREASRCAYLLQPTRTRPRASRTTRRVASNRTPAAARRPAAAASLCLQPQEASCLSRECGRRLSLTDKLRYVFGSEKSGGLWNQIGFGSFKTGCAFIVSDEEPLAPLPG